MRESQEIPRCRNQMWKFKFNFSRNRLSSSCDMIHNMNFTFSHYNLEWIRWRFNIKNELNYLKKKWITIFCWLFRLVSVFWINQFFYLKI